MKSHFLINQFFAVFYDYVLCQRVRTKQYISTVQAIFEVVVLPEVIACVCATRSDWKSRKYVLRMPVFFSHYSSSTKCSIVVVQVPGLPEVTFGHVTPERSSIGCAHSQPEVVQYSSQWGLLTGSDVIKCHPKGVPLGARMHFGNSGYRIQRMCFDCIMMCDLLLINYMTTLK